MKRNAPDVEKNFSRNEENKKNKFCRFPISLAIACIYASNAQALPQGPVIASGSVDIVTKDRSLDINQASNKAIINWQQFNIASGESVSFVQPSSSALILNRITGLNASFIDGQLSANGRVFIVNPNGVLFGKNAQVDVGGMVSSSLGISDKDFMHGNFQFSKSGNMQSSVGNAGSITAVDGGYIVLLSDHVKNDGNINASRGRVLMGAGSEVALYFARDSLIGYTISKETANALVENSRNIRAAGGTISLAATGMDNPAQSAAVNNTGIIEAKTLRNSSGKIELLADAKSGRINLKGTLDASATDGPGGMINTSAARVSVDSGAVVTTNSDSGKTGLWKIKAASARIGDNPEDIHPEALARNLSSSNITVSASANSHEDSGHLVMNKELISAGQNKLSLEAEKDVLINAPVNVDAGGMMIRVDTNGTGRGMLRFSQAGKLHASNRGPIDLYTNVDSFRNNTHYDNFITSPYSLWMLVNDVNQLQRMNENLAGKYALGRDIDASDTVNWNNGGGFSPIGNSWQQFTGQLDGMNRVISNLYINRPVNSNVGLISYSSGEIKNLGMINANITGNDSVGVLAGYNQGIIQNVYVTGSASLDVRSRYSEIAPNSAGGLVGNNGSKGQIKNAYSLAKVRGETDLGGIAGRNAGQIDNVYAAGKVGDYDFDRTRGGITKSGGITSFNSGRISNAYWTTDGTGQTYGVPYNSGTIDSTTETGGLNSAALKTASLNLDLDKVWTRYDGYTFPLLRSFLKPLDIYSVDSNITKVYDGASVDLQAKLYYSDPNAIGSPHLYSTPDRSFESLINVGNASYKNTRRFWSDQQGYYLSNPVVEQVVSMDVYARPVVIAATNDSKEFDASVNSALTPQISQAYGNNNMGLAEDDVISGKQVFDSAAPGNRIMQVASVQIRNSEGKDVTGNYRIAKLDGSGSIREKQLPQTPGNDPSTPPGNPDPDPNPTRPTTPQVISPQPAENNSTLPGTAPLEGSAEKPAANRIDESENVNNSRNTNSASTTNSSSDQASGLASGISNPANDYLNRRNIFLLTNLDKDEENREAARGRGKKSAVSLMVVDGGVNVPKDNN